MRTIPFLFCFLFSVGLQAQLQVSAYTDIGSATISRGANLRAGTFGRCQSNKYSGSAGLQYELVSYSTTVVSGLHVDAAREFQIKSVAFEIHPFFRYNRVTETTRESNWGAYAKINRKKFVGHLGVNFRTFALTGEWKDKLNLEENTRIRENWNLMYSFAYFIKPLDNKWNVGFTFTNIDRFLISQETNPIFNVQGSYQVKSQLKIFMETWYKSAGSMNLAVNYFNFFVRTGIVWDIDISK